MTRCPNQPRPRRPARPRRGRPDPTPLLFVHGAWHGAWCWEEHFLDRFAERATASRRSTSAGTARRRRAAGSRADGCGTTSPTSPRSRRPSTCRRSSSATRWAAWSCRSTSREHEAPKAVLLASGPPRGVARRHAPRAAAAPVTVPADERDLVALPRSSSTPTKARSTCSSATRIDEVTVLGYTARLQDEAYLAYLDMLVLDLPRPKRVRAPHARARGRAGRDLPATRRARPPQRRTARPRSCSTARTT